MKKVTTLFLAMLMCMALSVPALADTSISSGDGKVEYTATVEQPTINVTVPSASQTVILNPYLIKVTNSNIGASNAQGSILAARLILVSKSNVPLKTSLTVTGSIPDGSKAAFSTAEIASTEKNKKVFMFVQVGDPTDGAYSGGTVLSNVTYDSTNTKQGIVKAGDLKMTEVTTIPAPSVMTTGNWLPIDIGGQCTTSPTEGWTATDKVALTIVFSFQADKNTVSGA